MSSSTVIAKAQGRFTTIENNFQYLNTAVASKAKVVAAVNSTALSPSNNVITWTINHDLNTTNISGIVYKNGTEIVKTLKVISTSQIQIQIYSTVAISANSLKAIIIGA